MLKKRKYRLLYSSGSKGKPGPKGPSQELIDAIVEMKRRNSRFGCPRIAQEINKAFGVDIDKDQVSRYLVKDFGTSKSQNRLANATTYCAPDALRPCRFATPSQARRWLRSTPSNGWTAC